MTGQDKDIIELSKAIVNAIMNLECDLYKVRAQNALTELREVADIAMEYYPYD